MSSINRLLRRRAGRGGVDRAGWYREQWYRAAAATGWSVRPLTSQFLELRRGSERRLVFGTDAGLDTSTSFRLAGSSLQAVAALAAAGVPTPVTAHHLVTRPVPVIAAIRRQPGGLVVKPAGGTGGGQGVTVGPAGSGQALRALAAVGQNARHIALQEVVAGDVLRVLVVDGRVLDTVRRSPAAVLGDGASTVRELIVAENRRRAVLGPAATGFIPLGADCITAVERAGYRLTERLPAGERLIVAGTSNTGSELESSRVELSSDAAAVAVTAAEALTLRVGGVDLVVGDDGRPRAVLEVNGAPGLHWHVLVDNDPFDPFVALLDPPTGRQEARR